MPSAGDGTWRLDAVVMPYLNSVEMNDGLCDVVVWVPSGPSGDAELPESDDGDHQRGEAE